MNIISFESIKKLPFRPTETSSVCDVRGMEVMQRRFFKLTYAGLITYYVMVETRDTHTEIFGVVKVVSLYNSEGQFVPEHSRRWNWIRSLIESKINALLAERYSITIYIPKE